VKLPDTKENGAQRNNMRRGWDGLPCRRQARRPAMRDRIYFVTYSPQRKGGEVMKKLALSAGLLFMIGLAVIPMVVNQAPALAAAPASGMQVGRNLPPFDVKDVTGPWKGDAQVCYR
jgi:hypothetical protein